MVPFLTTKACGEGEPAQIELSSHRLPGWRWEVLKTYQQKNWKPGARWMCRVSSPMIPEGEVGDVWVYDILVTGQGRLDKVRGELPTTEQVEAIGRLREAMIPMPYPPGEPW